MTIPFRPPTGTNGGYNLDCIQLFTLGDTRYASNGGKRGFVTTWAVITLGETTHEQNRGELRDCETRLNKLSLFCFLHILLAHFRVPVTGSTDVPDMHPTSGIFSYIYVHIE